MAPYFSVILPIYNVEAYLERCVRSILQQSFTDYEIILVDDGSTDGCPALCDVLAQQYSCIRTIHKENGGLSSARNSGLPQALGEYVWWVDSDDWIEPDALQKLFAATETEKPDMVKFQYYRVEGAQSTPVSSNAAPGYYTNPEILLQQGCYTPGKFVLSAWSHLYRREFLLDRKLQYVSERLVGSEDYLFNLESYLLAQKVCVLPEYLYSYELRQGSLSQRHKKDLPQRYERLYDLLRKQYEKAGMLAKYEGWLSAFYLWHLLRGTCIPNAYWSDEPAALKEGRRQVAAFLKSCRKAWSRCDRSRFSRKQRLQLYLMKLGAEPVFYWLYVVKPRGKKGRTHENQA